MPVSYTHLDVYKRQDIYRQNRTDVKGIRTKKYGIEVEVLGIYVFNDVIYIHSCISNDTNRCV